MEGGVNADDGENDGGCWDDEDNLGMMVELMVRMTVKAQGRR